MRRIRSVGMACVAIALASRVAAAATFDRLFEMQGPIDAGGHCELAIINGSVEVHRSSDRICRLKAVIQGSGETPAQARAAAERTAIEHYTDRTLLRAYVKQGDAGLWERMKRVVSNWRSTSSVIVNYTVELPRGVEVRINTVNGRVRVEGATAGVKAQTVSGTVEVCDSDGELKLETVSGTVKGAQAKGLLAVNTVSGTVDVALAADGKGGSITTVSGNVSLAAGAAASLRVHTQTLSGTVENDFTGAGTMNVSIKTVSGDVHAHKQ